MKPTTIGLDLDMDAQGYQMQHNPVISKMPLSGNPVIQTGDPDLALHFAEMMFAPMKADLSRVRGPFWFALNAMTVANTMLSAQVQRTSCRSSFLVEPGTDRYFIEIPTVGTCRIRYEDGIVDARAGHSAIISSLRKPAFWEDIGEEYQALALHLRKSEVKRVYRALTGCDRAEDIEFAPALDFGTVAGADFLRAVNCMFEIADRPDSLLSDDRSAILFEEFLINALLSNFDHSLLPREGDNTTETSMKVVRRAEDLMRARCDDPLTVSDVADALDVSVRTLQRSFRTHLGKSPMKVLKEARLDRARTRLKKDGPEIGVTAIAIKSGFSHLGAFSVDYRRRFGETPSQTIARAG